MPAGACPVILLVVLALLGVCLEPVVGVSCAELEQHMNTEGCTGTNGGMTVSAVGCPYSFVKPACSQAEPQAPRDLTNGATGNMVPKAATLNEAQAEALPLANVHFHLGAEHKTEEYMDDADSILYDSGNRRLATNPRPGYMCSNEGLTTAQLASYDFVHCKGDVQVGKSYEVHYVHSSAGYSDAELAGVTDIDLMDDGLGGAANGRGIRNPMIVVQAQVFHIVNDGPFVDDMLHGWSVVGHENSVKYMGSTTGPSHNNQMKEQYNLEADLYPHGSRIIVDGAYVVQSQYVQPLTGTGHGDGDGDGHDHDPEADVAAKLGGGDTGHEAMLLAGLVAASRM